MGSDWHQAEEWPPSGDSATFPCGTLQGGGGFLTDPAHQQHQYSNGTQQLPSASIPSSHRSLPCRRSDLSLRARDSHSPPLPRRPSHSPSPTPMHQRTLHLSPTPSCLLRPRRRLVQTLPWTATTTMSQTCTRSILILRHSRARTRPSGRPVAGHSSLLPRQSVVVWLPGCRSR